MLMDVEAMPSTATKIMPRVCTVHTDNMWSENTRVHTLIIDTHIPNCILHYGSHI